MDLTLNAVTADMQPCHWAKEAGRVFRVRRYRSALGKEPKKETVR